MSALLITILVLCFLSLGGWIIVYAAWNLFWVFLPFIIIFWIGWMLAKRTHK